MQRSKNDELREFDEEAARAFAFETLKPYFYIYEEVWLRSQIEERFRIDAVAVCSIETYLIGLEFKRSHLKMSEFSDALRQSINYRDAIIDDPRFPSINEKRVHACFVFPDWDGVHEDGSQLYKKEAFGMKVLANHFRVGVLSRTQRKDSCSFVLGNQGVWHSSSGWTQAAKGLMQGKRKRGSGTKRFD